MLLRNPQHAFKVVVVLTSAQQCLRGLLLNALTILTICFGILATLAGIKEFA